VVSDAGIEAMAKHKTIFSPQLAVTAAWNEDFMRKAGCFPDWMIRNAMEARAHHHEGFAKAVKSGLKFVAGVDNLPRVPLFHGIERFEGKPALIAELRFMIDNGLPPMEALRAATVNTAELSRVADVLGTVERGKLADLIAVDGDPLTDISALHAIRLIMKGGTIIRSALPGSLVPGFVPPVEWWDAPIELTGDTAVTGTSRRHAASSEGT
jgi:imidazolonepropionase-like amidohydrolase